MARHSRKGSDRFVRLTLTIAVVVVLVAAALVVLAIRGCSSAKPANRQSKAHATVAASGAKAGQATTSSAVTKPSVPSTPVSDPATDQVVPVLMYHHISPTAKNSIAITPETFDQQMKWLHDHGYHAIHTAQLADFLATGRRLPEKPVLITFDDGRMNQIQYGVPILKKYGFTATFFMNKKWITSPSDSFMHADDVGRLEAAGYDVESHTNSHTFLVKSKSEDYALMKKRLWGETYGHKGWLEALTRKPVIALAYPGGAHDALSPRLVQESGFAMAFTVESGLVRYKGQSSMLLPRYNAGARGLRFSTFTAIFTRAEAASKPKASKVSTPSAQ